MEQIMHIVIFFKLLDRKQANNWNPDGNRQAIVLRIDKFAKRCVAIRVS